MKKIIYSLLFAALFSACSTDFLDRNPLDKPSNEAFWRTEKDAMAAATGCYNGWFSMDEVIVRRIMLIILLLGKAGRYRLQVQRPRPIRVIAIWGMETWFAIIISWRISIAPK